jgi:hypothetical protein
MTIDIDWLIEAELVDVNDRIVERLRFLDQAKVHSQMLSSYGASRERGDPGQERPQPCSVYKSDAQGYLQLAEDGLHC